MRFIQLCSLSAAVIILSACASNPASSPPAQTSSTTPAQTQSGGTAATLKSYMSQLQIGMSEAEVTQILGDPTSVAVHANGAQRWVYKLGTDSAETRRNVRQSSQILSGAGIFVPGNTGQVMRGVGTIGGVIPVPDGTSDRIDITVIFENNLVKDFSGQSFN